MRTGGKEYVQNNSRVLRFNVELAEKIGLNESIVLCQIDYWVSRNAKANRNYFDGCYWTYNSYNQWKKQFPFWSVRTIKTVIGSLRTHGLVIVDQRNKMKLDRTNWYTIDYSALEKICPSFMRFESVNDPDEFIVYEEYISSPQWADKRKQRMKLDGFQCAMCGTAKNLNVHHITYDRLGHEDMEDLITLCNNCHAKVHENDLAKKSKKTD